MKPLSRRLCFKPSSRGHATGYALSCQPCPTCVTNFLAQGAPRPCYKPEGFDPHPHCPEVNCTESRQRLYERFSKLLVHGWIMDDLGGSCRFTRIPSQASVRYRFALVKVRRPSDPLILRVACPAHCCPLLDFLLLFLDVAPSASGAVACLRAAAQNPGSVFKQHPFRPALATFHYNEPPGIERQAFGS